MRSWIGLYALLKMIRDAKMQTFTRDGITAMLRKAKDVPMLGIFGDEKWTPNTNHAGLFKRAGTEPLGRLHLGLERQEQRIRRQLRRELDNELRQGVVRLAVRCVGSLLIG